MIYYLDESYIVDQHVQCERTHALLCFYARSNTEYYKQQHTMPISRFAFLMHE